MRYEEPVYIGGRKLFFSIKSFEKSGSELLQIILDHARLSDAAAGDRAHRSAHLDAEVFGLMLAKTYEFATHTAGPRSFQESEEELPVLPHLFWGSLETPLKYSPANVILRFCLEYIEPPAAKILLRPKLVIEQKVINAEEATLFECAQPGMLYQDTYYRFSSQIKRTHLLNLSNDLGNDDPRASFWDVCGKRPSRAAPFCRSGQCGDHRKVCHFALRRQTGSPLQPCPIWTASWRLRSFSHTTAMKFRRFPPSSITTI